MKAIPLTATPWIPPEANRQLRSFFYEHCSLVQLKKKEVLHFQRNQWVSSYEDSLILLNRGLLGQFMSTGHENKEFISSLLLPNRLYGTKEFIRRQNCQSSLVALRQSEILVLPFQKLTALASESPQLQEFLIQYSFCCLESEKQSMYLVATEDVRSRLGKLFRALIHSTRACETGSSYQIPLRLSNEELRKLIYTTKKTINTVLPEWKKQGLYSHSKEATILSKAIL